MPKEHLEFLKSLRLHYQLGDYFFTHTGVRSRIPLDQKSEDGLLWIWSEFLKFQRRFWKNYCTWGIP